MIDEIVFVISTLPLKEALTYIVAQKVVDYSTKGYDKIKKVIVDKQNEGKYAFVPNKEEVLLLEQAEKNPDYQQILILVPNYKYLDLIKTGLLLKEYNRRIDNGIDPEKNKMQISQIKVDIIRRPGGGRLLKIAKLPASQFFSIILSYLYELKIHSYPENQIEEEFNDLVDEWDKCALYVDDNAELNDVVEFCKRMIKENKSRFFLLALYEHQINIIEQGISNLEQEQLLKKNDYLTKIEKEDSKGVTPRIEVRFYKNPDSP